MKRVFIWLYAGICIAVSLILILQLKDISWKKSGLVPPENFPVGIPNGIRQATIIVETRPVVTLVPQPEIASPRLNIQNDSVFNLVTFLKIWQISEDLRRLKANPEAKIFFLFNLKGKEPIDKLPRQEELDAVKGKIMRDPASYDGIISRDLSATFIQVDFIPGLSYRQIFLLLREIRARYKDARHNIYLSGKVVLRGWMDAYLEHIIAILVIIALTVSLILFGFFAPLP